MNLYEYEENLYEISKEVADYLESQNVVYAEVRFAPMFHTKEGLSYNEIVEAVRDGLRSNPNVKTNLILCYLLITRNAQLAEKLKTGWMNTTLNMSQDTSLKTILKLAN